VCGSRDHLEIDHRDPGEKLSHRIWSWSPARRDAELAKCQVLCRKHHHAKSGEERRALSLTVSLTEPGDPERVVAATR
jgi:hypothetical protein